MSDFYSGEAGTEQNGYASKAFFPNNAFPQVVSARERNYVTPTRYNNHSFVELFYVKSGSGEVIINGISLPLSSGVGGLIKSYDFHKFIPNKTTGLLNYNLCVNLSSMLFINASPYQTENLFEIADVHNQCRLFSQEMQSLVAECFAALCDLFNEGDVMKSGRAVFSSIEMIGYFLRELHDPSRG